MKKMHRKSPTALLLSIILTTACPTWASNLCTSLLTKIGVLSAAPAHHSPQSDPLFLKRAWETVPQIQLSGPKITELHIGEVDSNLLGIGNSYQLSGELSKTLAAAGISAEVKTVLYPMASHDALTPFILFPDSTTVVAIDSAPFVRNTSKPIQPAISEGEGSGLFHFNYQARKAESVAGEILARLMANYPQIRIHRIQAIEENSDFTQDWDPEERGRIVSVHGQIEFDTGPNTLLRRYIHLNLHLTDNFDKQTWWHQQLERQNFQAIISRAAFGGLESTAPILFQKMLKKLAGNEGIFIDGDQSDPKHYSVFLPEKAEIYRGPSFGGYIPNSNIIIFGTKNYRMQGFESIDGN